MPVLPIKHVASFSSEVAGCDADHVLVDSPDKVWKGKAGQKQSLILQLDKAGAISSVTIGNSGAAFVELLVARSASDSDTFQTLMPMQGIMNAKDSRDWTNTERVAHFGSDKFNDGTKAEKWDRVKIVCTQMWNKGQPFGLSYVQLHSKGGTTKAALAPSSSAKKGAAAAAEGSASLEKKFGMFKKRTPPKRTDSVTLFRGHSVSLDFEGAAKEAKETTAKAAVEIADAAKAHKAAAAKAAVRAEEAKKAAAALSAVPVKRKLPAFLLAGGGKPAKLPAAKPTKFKADKGGRASSSTTGAAAAAGAGGRKKAAAADPIKKRRTSPDDKKGKGPKVAKPFLVKKKPESDIRKRKRSSSPPPAGAGAGAPETGSSDKGAGKKKAFDSLLEGVVFTLSGVQNPYRHELRKKALDMGALYRPDWARDCTHCVSAFEDTPKYQAAEAAGGINVRTDWVEDCFDKKRRVKEDRYQFRRAPRKAVLARGVSDDDEEEEEMASTSGSEWSAGSLVAMDADSDEEFIPRKKKGKRRRVDKKAAAAAPAARVPIVPPVSSTAAPSKAKAGGESAESDYDAPTDSGSETEPPKPAAAASAAPVVLGFDLPDFLGGIVMFMHELPTTQEKKIKRFALAYGADVRSYVTADTTHVVTSKAWDAEFDELAGDNPKIVFVRPEWVEKCHEDQKFCDLGKFKTRKAAH